jgi:outer membrane protein assembly factor BamB
VSTGAHAWTFAFPHGDHNAPVAISAADGVFYVADAGCQVWRLSPRGTELGHFTVPGPYAWSVKVSNGVLCGFSGGQSDQGLYALNASTGRDLWSKAPYGVNYTIAAADGVVYVSGGTNSNTSVLMRVDASTGKVGWQREWPNNTLADSPLAYVPGTLLVGVGQTLCALDAATGKQQWQVALNGQATAVAVAGAVAYVSVGTRPGGGLYAIRL